jgi:NTE family protein
MLSRLWLALRRPRLAVVLGGGGTRGAYQVGVIDSLAGAGVVPDLLVGTSAGSINATWWAFHPDAGDARGLLDIWLSADRSVVLPPGRMATLRHLLRGEHLVSHQGLMRLLELGLRPDQAIEEAAIPLTITATDPSAGRAVRLRSGAAIPAVLASSAVPALYPTVRIGDRQLVDGGLVANCDVQAAVEAGATDVIVVDIMGSPAPIPAPDHLLTLERMLDIALGRQTDQAIELVRRSARVVLLRAPGRLLPRFGDLARTRELFEAGRRAGVVLVDQHLAGRRCRPGRVSLPAE